MSRLALWTMIVGLLFTAMVKNVPVWILLFYLLSRAPKPKKA